MHVNRFHTCPAEGVERLPSMLGEPSRMWKWQPSQDNTQHSQEINFWHVSLDRIIISIASLLYSCTSTKGIMYAGRVYSAEAVGRVAQREGVTFMLDACQSVGQMPLDVQALGCDYLTGTGRKYLRGPRGSGFLYASRQASSPSYPMSPCSLQEVHGKRGLHVCMGYFPYATPQWSPLTLACLKMVCSVCRRASCWVVTNVPAPERATNEQGLASQAACCCASPSPYAVSSLTNVMHAAA